MKRKRQKLKKFEEGEEDIVPSEDSSSDCLEGDDDLLNSSRFKHHEDEEEVLKVYTSSDDSDVSDDEYAHQTDGNEKTQTNDKRVDELPEGDAVDTESSEEEEDIEDILPDSKAWGTDRKQYYNTDYVDKDYLGFDDEEAALQEEEEAIAIQTRLMSQLEGVDFSLGLFEEIEKRKLADKEKPLLDEKVEEVEVDLSKLSQKELVDILERESPGFIPIIRDCKERVKALNDLTVIIKLIDSGSIPPCKANQAIELFYQAVLQYALNVLCLIHLKKSGERTHNHPIMKRIKQFRFLLNELEPLIQKLQPQINFMINEVNKGEELKFNEKMFETTELEPKNRKERRKRKLELLKKAEMTQALIRSKKKKLMLVENPSLESRIDGLDTVGDLEEQVVDDVVPSSGGEESEEEEEKDTKRSVPFQILKNKGLTPRRKKENRNPRVKHRNKYKKALKRRRGAVREPRKELEKYGGEISGIKKNLAKSIKLN